MVLRSATALLDFFLGPKKSRFSGPTPSNAPCNAVALLKTITYRAIKTTGTLIVIVIRSKSSRQVKYPSTNSLDKTGLPI